MSFDPALYGLMSHYSPEAQQRLRRLILEDWKAAGVKLPTYMKLLARYIAPTGVAEDWLGKLSHQTMDKMLKSISTPRHEFWSCLHLYLAKKYGPLEIDDQAASDADILGQALVRFGAVDQAEDFEGSFALDGKTSLLITLCPDRAYSRVASITKIQTDEAFTELAYAPLYGVGIKQGNRLVAVLRDMSSRIITAQIFDKDTLSDLNDDEMRQRLENVAGDA